MTVGPRRTVVYVVKDGDTLWDLSDRFLANPWYWKKIWAANPFIENPHWIYPGQRLAFVAVGTDGAEVRPATEEEIERAEEQGLSEEGEAVLEDDEEEAEEDEAEDDGDFEDNSDEPSKRKVRRSVLTCLTTWTVPRLQAPELVGRARAPCAPLVSAASSTCA